MKTNTYKLSGIDCASCALKIEDNLTKTEGVEEASVNFMFMKCRVKFDETIVTDETIETTIHKSLSGVRIEEKNNEYFEDTYSEPGVFKKILFRPRNKRQ